MTVSPMAKFQGGDIAEVQAYHNHSSLLGWYLREEPTGNGKR